MRTLPRFRLDNQVVLLDDQAWNVADGRSIGTVSPEQQGNYQGRWFDDFNNGETTLYADMTGVTLTIKRQTKLHTLETLEIKPVMGDFSYERLAFSPQGQLIAMSRPYDDSDNARVDVWNTNDGTMRQAITFPTRFSWSSQAVPSEMLNSVVIPVDEEIQLYRLK